MPVLAEGRQTRRFLRTPTARPHHAVDFGVCGRLWKLWTRLCSTSSKARAILTFHFADGSLYEEAVIFSTGDSESPMLSLRGPSIAAQYFTTRLTAACRRCKVGRSGRGARPGRFTR